MSYTDILFGTAGGVATITINRPEALNALRLETIDELTSAVLAAGADPEIGVVVLRGAGGRAFCVGGDQKVMVSTLNRAGWYVLAGKLRDLFAAVRRCGKPVIAAVEGWCIGGGHELHCFCDLTIATESSRFGQVGARVGGAPVFATRLLPRLIGEKRAREVLFLCEQYTAAEALQFGLVNRVVPDGELDAAVARMCADLLAKSPSVLRALKLGVNVDDVLSDAFLPLLVESLADFFGSAEQREATGAYAAKRAPDFSPFRRSPS
ncbi:enoyl-CoA hydratase-related protein [Dactylosporangium sp. CS-047395]|uniref:enoyl-CoA hydratase-related protein n=1 Tax=Dactylosporangium sp. CS-047395 TaxID=3239936 RepID=UPI003D94686B